MNENFQIEISNIKEEEFEDYDKLQINQDEETLEEYMNLLESELDSYPMGAIIVNSDAFIE